jgi:hypothetical protein
MGQHSRAQVSMTEFTKSLFFVNPHCMEHLRRYPKLCHTPTEAYKQCAYLLQHAHSVSHSRNHVQLLRGAIHPAML